MPGCKSSATVLQVLRGDGSHWARGRQPPQSCGEILEDCLPHGLVAGVNPSWKASCHSHQAGLLQLNLPCGQAGTALKAACAQNEVAHFSGSPSTKQHRPRLVGTSWLVDSPAWRGCRRPPAPAADPQSVGSWSAHPVQPPLQQWQWPQLQQLPVLQAVHAAAALLHLLLQWPVEPVTVIERWHAARAPDFPRCAATGAPASRLALPLEGWQHAACKQAGQAGQHVSGHLFHHHSSLH